MLPSTCSSYTRNNGFLSTLPARAPFTSAAPLHSCVSGEACGVTSSHRVSTGLNCSSAVSPISERSCLELPPPPPPSLKFLSSLSMGLSLHFSSFWGPGDPLPFLSSHTAEFQHLDSKNLRLFLHHSPLCHLGVQSVAVPKELLSLHQTSKSKLGRVM